MSPECNLQVLIKPLLGKVGCPFFLFTWLTQLQPPKLLLAKFVWLLGKFPEQDYWNKWANTFLEDIKKKNKMEKNIGVKAFQKNKTQKKVFQGHVAVLMSFTLCLFQLHVYVPHWYCYGCSKLLFSIVILMEGADDQFRWNTGCFTFQFSFFFFLRFSLYKFLCFWEFRVCGVRGEVAESFVSFIWSG